MVNDINLDDVSGWLSKNEQLCLKKYAALSTTDIFEIGTWVGKSTICLAKGLLPSYHKVVTCDIFPTEKNFKYIDDELFGFFINNQLFGRCSAESYINEIEPILKQGVKNVLYQNLKRHGVDFRVKVIDGNFANLRKSEVYYDTVFCDVCHDEAEISCNVPKILNLFGGDFDKPVTYLFHDINDRLYTFILRNNPQIVPLERVDSIFVFSVGGSRRE